METIGNRIAQARALCEGLSSSELARLAGLNRTHLSNLEHGLREQVEGKTAIALARVLGVSTDWLLMGTGVMPSTEMVRQAVDDARRSGAGAVA